MGRGTNTEMWRVGLVVVAGLAACGGGTSPGGVDTRPVVAEVPAAIDPALDLLLVIDDSSSADVQSNLSQAMPSFFDRLAQAFPDGRLPDLHIAVATSDLGTTTSTSEPAPPLGTVGQGGCSGTGRGGAFTVGTMLGITGNFVTDIALSDGTRQRNYVGEDLATTVGQMAIVGVGGCGFEQPLAAMKAALDGNPANAGFRRPAAALAVFFLTDEDDCSVHDPALFGPDAPGNPLQSFRCTRFGVTCGVGGRTSDEMNALGPKSACGPNIDPDALVEHVDGFHDFLLGLVDDPRRLRVGGLFGDPSPVVVEPRTVNGQSQPALAHSCTYPGPDGSSNTPDDQVADPGVRLQAFADLFPGRATTGSMCHNDLSPPMIDIAQQFAFAIGTPCISRDLADTDPELDGLQPDCVVEDRIDDVITPIPDCEQQPDATCWSLVPDPACRLAGLRLDVHRLEPLDPRTVTTMRCALP